MKRVRAMMLVAVLVLVGAACNTQLSNKPVSSKPPTSNAPATSKTAAKHTTTTTAPPTTAAPAVAHVGSTIAVTDGEGGQANVTLVKVIDPAQGADEFTTPDAGKRFVGVEFTIKNTGTGTKALSQDANSSASVIGSDNQTYTADFDDIAGCTNFNEGVFTLAAGESSTGCVVYQLPTAVHVVKVQFDLSGFGMGTIGQWDVP